MLAKIGAFFAEKVRRLLPDSFVLALLLTVVAGIMAFLSVAGLSPVNLVQAWYKGFWDLLTFGMQMVLILTTGYAVAVSAPASRLIDWLASRIKTPLKVYFFVVFIGCLFTLVSWGWIVLTAVLARELAIRVKKVDYRLLAACVYVSFIPWHGGLSGSVPLLLNTPNNFLIETGVLSTTLSTSLTLGSTMNIIINLVLLLSLPVLMVLMRPGADRIVEFSDLGEKEKHQVDISITQEAENMKLQEKNISDWLNNSFFIQLIISILGLIYLAWHFLNHGFDLNLNLMILVFIITGMVLHRTPVCYVIAMKRSCRNVSGIILQFPFYAGIMGIMIYTGLGKIIALWLADSASIHSLPAVSFLLGGLVNIFVPSGGGEWAVVGPTIVEATKSLGTQLSSGELNEFIARVAMAEAYGDAWTNMIQPFWTLAFLPVIGAGVRIQARDIMGYTFVALLWSGIVFILGVTFLPL